MRQEVHIRFQPFLSSLLLLVICLTFITGCVDDISVHLPTNQPNRLVIEGAVERSADVYQFLISVSRTQSLVEPVFNLEEDVVITLVYNRADIVNLSNGQPWISSVEQFDHLYGPVSGSDQFNIKVETVAGAVFESEPQKILDSPHGGSIGYELEERSVLNELENLIDQSFVKIKINTPVVNDMGERVSMIWNASGVYEFVEGDCTTDIYGSPRRCYVSEYYGGSIANVLQSNKVSGDQVEGFEILETTATPQFTIGYYLTLIRKSVSQEAGSYWNELQKSQQREGTIFDPPTGAITSNIKQISGKPEPVVGYFYTAAVDTLRQLGDREVAGFLPLYCASNPAGFGCCDCRQLPFSSTEKPSYWK